MQEPFAPAIAANRFGLGARPGELARIGPDARDWLTAQLKGGAPTLADSGLRSSADVLVETFELRRKQREARNADAEREADAPSANAKAVRALLKLPALYRPIYIAEANARFRHAVATERPFVERLTHFWTNHFAVSIDKLAVLGLAGAFEREAIRPHVLGRFRDLLLAAEQHPAMLLYLDNHVSVGPGSRAARLLSRRRSGRQAGINENLAREILELHTLGVNGGYTQKDVTSFAKVLTGWSIGGNVGPARGGEPGKFTFREQIHEPGAQTVLGKTYSQDGVEQGIAVLEALAASPATARFIATKLARHFIADEPPAAAVARIEQAFMRSGGDLPSVYRALIDAPEAWQTPFAKYKTPSDYVISTFRGLALPVEQGQRALASFEVLGQRTYSPGSPAGWPDRSADWDGASALLKRIEWADAVGQRIGTRVDAVRLAEELLGPTLSADTREAIARAASGAQAVTLLLTAPEFMRR
ncbi:MAG: DUF1800 domain-containing protein [Steroidobacteraceae bacterium]|nr:DUF1800 domain-containing protein [Steroidobacteraceae bacterium]